MKPKLVIVIAMWKPMVTADVELPFEYSTEKKDWLEAAVAEFQRANPTAGRTAARRRGDPQHADDVVAHRQAEVTALAALSMIRPMQLANTRIIWRHRMTRIFQPACTNNASVPEQRDFFVHSDFLRIADSQ